MLDMTSSEVIEPVVPVYTKAQTEERRRMVEWLDGCISASKKKPSAEVVTLTPMLASLLLSRNPVNRPIGRYNLENLKADVANKRWEFNGESLVVARSGVLIDGQHRCETVIATNIAIETVIVFGPREEARYTIDIGKPKTAPNFLHMKGWTDTNNMSAMITLLLQYRATGNIHHGYDRPTKTEILEAAEGYKGLQESIDAVRDATKKKLGSRSVLAFCHYTFWKKAGREACDLFISQMIEGEGIRKGSPIYYCRERLIGMDRGTRAESRAELIFKCWNAWRRNETITKVVLNGNLPKVER